MAIVENASLFIRRGMSNIGLIGPCGATMSHSFADNYNYFVTALTYLEYQRSHCH